MRINLKPKAYIFPLPVLIIGTYDENNIPNAMTAAWGCVSDYQKVSIVIDKNHKTMKNILLNKEFSVSITNSDNAKYADYVGLISGNDVNDKLIKTNWNIIKSDIMNAPIFDKLPLCLLCKMENYDEEKELLIGEVISISCDESILTNGKVDIVKLDPLCYDCENHGYYKIGKLVGKAFSIGSDVK